jgi:hypothetical protein
VKAFHVSFRKRLWNEPGEIHATVHAENKKGETRLIKFTFDFSCLPYIRNDLKRLWESGEKQSRQRLIDEVSEAVGS